jgi:mRNA interferase RelE/StbE
LVVYRIEFVPAAARQMRNLDPPVRRRLDAAIQALRADPRPPACKKLSGREEYRIRVGDYRILYEVEDTVLRVLVVKVGHRRDVYA